MAEDGFPVAVHDLGGRGPQVLLAHATGFHGRTWQPLADVLAHRFHCIAFDQRGHGESGAGAGDSFDWHDLAADVLSVVDGMGRDRPLALGHSSGATLLLLAEEARPGTFRALYCYEPIVAPVDDPPAPDPARPLAVRARKRRDVFAGREEALVYLRDRPAFRALDPACMQAYVDHGFDDLDDGSVRLKCRPEVEALHYEHGMSHRAFRHLGRVRCPVVLGCGERTDAMGPDLLGALATRLPHVRVEVLPGLGHFGPLEDPARVAAAVERAFGLAS